MSMLETQYCLAAARLLRLRRCLTVTAGKSSAERGPAKSELMPQRKKALWPDVHLPGVTVSTDTKSFLGANERWHFLCSDGNVKQPRA